MAIVTATIERTPLRLWFRPLLAATIALAVTGVVLAPMPASAQPEGGSSGSHVRRDDHPVIISEIAPGWGDRPDASYVELRNVSSGPVDLTGWNLYRCSEEGLRSKRGAPDSEFSGVVLAPGQHYLIARAGERPAGATPDDVMSAPFGAGGYGYVLEDPEQRVADSVAVYPTTPWMMRSECDPSGSLPDIVDSAAGESYQRLGATATDDGRFVIAPATPGSANRAGRLDAPSTSGVVIAEVAPFGSGGSGDDLVELRNDGAEAVSLDGWALVRCTAAGERAMAAPQAQFDAGDVLAPGERLVVVGPASSIRDADAVMATSLADAAYGLQVRDAAGAVVDEVASAHQRDSACQSGPEKLPATLDAVRNESHQRLPDGGGWIVAPRTPGAANARAEQSLRAERVLDTGVVISELATDPLDVRAITRPHNFVELTNRSDRAVEVGGWRVWACDRDGMRRAEPLAELASGTELAPGASIVIAAEGTPTDAELRYARPLDFLGAGVLVETDEGGVADRVGAYHVNEMDESVEPPSPCTNAVSLVTFQPDRLRGETYHRVGRSGVDLVDFVTAAASPGVPESAVARAAALDEPRRRPAGEAARVTDAPLDAATVAGVDTPGGEPLSASGPALARVVAGTTGPDPAVAWELASEREVAIDAASPLPATTAGGHEYPALRLELAAPLQGAVAWTGTVSPRHRVALSAWNPSARQWSLVGEAVADPQGVVTVTGTAETTEAVLVQVLPAPRATADLEPDAEFERLDDIDASIVHLTDTQYLSEGYPEEYERMTRWIVELGQRHGLAAVVHTGDLVQSWVDPDQSDARARIEFARASTAQAVLEEAGLVTTVLPGNHDTKRGIDAALYNECFGPERYADAPGFVAPIAPDDATSSYTIVQAGPAPVLVLSIGYGYGERELAWAEHIVQQHPDHNVVIATHEHLTPLTRWDPARRATDNRWLSRADELWERVVAPNRNVVAVLAGHYHGLGAIVTPDAGGIEGHTVVELLADYQEFRTDSGERATGFLRLLQWDLAAGQLLVDTYSPRLDATVSTAYDYLQFVLENGAESRPSNGRPWNIVALGAEGRYGVADDEFAVPVTLQYEKALGMTGLTLTAPEAEPLESQSRGPLLGVPRV
ncbi:lamin tail domain-containing protein [Microcella humidisoli]|uniref:Lamin tail domain-containing protein n=1 Tax=Microcella humidisoli TaxID=2963406 RepID=A0ABY5FTY3_9MICO|nr:lamin tail domain-containing protein [Microcella humidisoli]UTT61708.1 lamin tail domain-containing protein [Microcella humidisoli]